MGCKSSSLNYVAKDFKLTRSGVEQFDQIYEKAEATISTVFQAMTAITISFDNFAHMTGMTAGSDYPLCFGLLAMVCSAIAVTHGDWNELGLQFSDRLPGIYMDAEGWDEKLDRTCAAWTDLCVALVDGLKTLTESKLQLCELLKQTRLAPDYLVKRAFDTNTEISTFRSQESVAEDNDKAVQQANTAVQNLALNIIEIVEEATRTIEALAQAQDLSVLRRIARKAEDQGFHSPADVLPVVAGDLNTLVQDYKRERGI